MKPADPPLKYPATTQAVAVSNSLARTAHVGGVAILQLIMLAELILLIGSERWMCAFLVAGLMAALLAPIVLNRLRSMLIPSGDRPLIPIVGTGLSQRLLGASTDALPRCSPQTRPEASAMG